MKMNKPHTSTENVKNISRTGQKVSKNFTRN